MYDCIFLYILMLISSNVSYIGLAHSLSGEEATLLKLNTESSAELKMSYEWGHVVMFPNVLLHACLDKLKGKGNSLKRGKKV